MASKDPEVNRLITQAINEVPLKVLSPDEELDREIATREYLTKLHKGQVQTRGEIFWATLQRIVGNYGRWLCRQDGEGGKDD